MPIRIINLSSLCGAGRRIVKNELRKVKNCVSNDSVHCAAVVAEATSVCGVRTSVGARRQPTQQASACVTVAVVRQRRRSAATDTPSCTRRQLLIYRSVSLLLYGTDSYHELLRLTTAVEILSNQQWYDTKHNCRCPFKDERRSKQDISLL